MRLIDADRMKTTHEIQMGDYNSMESIREWIDSQPTAYDVEAVVRELEAKSTFYAHEAEGDKDMGYEYLTIRKYGISDGLDVAIEIVKRGGRNA